MSPARSKSNILTSAAMDKEEEDLFVTEYAVSASEDEEDSDNERKHRKLLDAISSLDGKKRRKLQERTEASLQVSEFGISSEGTGEKISLSDLIEPIKKSTSLAPVKKQLNKVTQQKSEELPLTKEETQRIQRTVAYEKATEEVGKWDHIVKQNRRAEQLVFPVNEEKPKPTPIEEVVTGWKARTPLEQEVFNILHKNKQPINDPLLTPVEESTLKAMSLEEAKLRRAELQKARVLQSYYESKARRERKIKSKKFHKVLKKSKQKEALKEFEELKKTNPEAALEELQKLERTRMEERMTLKHQNSGKWAKSKAIMAKYDDDARKAMQEQLQQNKELTRKIEILSSSDESDEEEIIPDFVNDAQLNTDGPNPWMTGKLSSETNETAIQEVDPETQAALQTDVKEQEVHDDSEEELSEEETLLQEFEDKRQLRKGQEMNEVNNPETIKEGLGDAEEDVGEERVSEFNQLFQRLSEQYRNSKNKPLKKGTSHQEKQDEPEMEEPEEERDEGPLLTERLERKQTLEEVGDLGGEEWEGEPVQQLAPSSKKKSSNETTQLREATQPNTQKKTKKAKLIDQNEVLPAKAEKVKVPMLPTTVEEEVENDEVDQKIIIQEAFAGDDVIKDFLKEKRSAEEAGKPKDINLVLPGWGEWGGSNVQVSKRKRRKFIIKAAPAAPRKDQRMPNVIINEKRNIMVAVHQVNELPFPFSNKEHFESSIRAPIGNTWNTQRSFQKLTAPRVITKKGHIIEPITEEVFQKYNSAKKPAVELNAPKEHSMRQSKGSRQRKKAL
ncbi:U3 small nucleolar RNA-associated protein 14 homolog A isoform 2-T2 [Discoglossus pictus]